MSHLDKYGDNFFFLQQKYRFKVLGPIIICALYMKVHFVYIYSNFIVHVLKLAVSISRR